MPTLADIYSTADSLKRRLYDTLSNPGASLSQMVGYANDRARAFNELNAKALQETQQTGKLYGSPAQEELGQTIAEAYAPGGMTVYHGSPHLFEVFDPSKIGTGEGAQAYGRGMYMAQNKGVASNYSTMLGIKNQDIVNSAIDRVLNINNADPSKIRDALVLEGFSREKITPELEKNIKTIVQNYDTKTQTVNDTALNAYRQLQKLVPSEGQLYKVDLPDTHIRRMLDWDAPLSNQPKQVRDLAKTLGMDMTDLGGDLVAKVGKGEEGKQILQKAGIRGIKYFDQMSRGEKTGTRNFVVFDPNHLTILERNNQPIK